MGIGGGSEGEQAARRRPRRRHNYIFVATEAVGGWSVESISIGVHVHIYGGRSLLPPPPTQPHNAQRMDRYDSITTDRTNGGKGGGIALPRIAIARQWRIDSLPTYSIDRPTAHTYIHTTHSNPSHLIHAPEFRRAGAAATAAAAAQRPLALLARSHSPSLVGWLVVLLGGVCGGLGGVGWDRWDGTKCNGTTNDQQQMPTTKGRKRAEGLQSIDRSIDPGVGATHTGRGSKRQAQTNAMHAVVTQRGQYNNAAACIKSGSLAVFFTFDFGRVYDACSY